MGSSSIPLPTSWGDSRTAGLGSVRNFDTRLAGLSVAQPPPGAAVGAESGISRRGGPDPEGHTLSGAGSINGFEYPASRSQQRMWFLYQLAPDSAVYSIAVRVASSRTAERAKAGGRLSRSGLSS